MREWEIDATVLLIFYKRSEQLQRTFDAIKAVRPRQLLLWQDGPCDESDMEGMLACRNIVEQIDWDCVVHRRYNDKNYGCDPSTFYAHKWAFSIADKCIVLEDDHVANRSFFYFCKELLDKYENDTRINHICGMNVLGEYKDYPYDYLFGYTGTNAWASWKRVVDGWDESYLFLHDKRAEAQLRRIYGKQFDRWLKVARQRETTGVPYWESILCFDSIMHSRLAIIASRNMVKNIGLTENSTHSQTQSRFLTKTEKRIFECPTFEYEFPLKDPPYIIADLDYYVEVNKLMGNGHPAIQLGRKLYHGIKYIQYGEGQRIMRKLLGR